MWRRWVLAACAAVLVNASSDAFAEAPADDARPSLLSVLHPGQTVLVARFQFGFELVIVDDRQGDEDDAHRVAEVGRDYVVLVQGDWEKRVAATAIAVIGRKTPGESPNEAEVGASDSSSARRLQIRRDKTAIQGRWHVVSAHVGGRKVELPRDVVWTFHGDDFLAGGYFPAAIEGHRDPGRGRFELELPREAHRVVHAAFLKRPAPGRDAEHDDESAGKDRTAPAKRGLNKSDISRNREEDEPVNSFRLAVTLLNGGRSALEGVYDLDGDTLRICIGAERPAYRLDTVDDDGLMLFELRRIVTSPQDPKP